MKATTKKFFVMLLSFVMLTATCFGLVGNLQRHKADAWSVNSFIRSKITKKGEVYYFSDDSIGKFSLLTNEKVVADIHDLITPQELEFMLYTGYFWGFDPSLNTRVVIEIKTMKPDSSTIANLISCLNAQNCSVMFVSPYKTEYGNLGAKEAMPCNKGEYSRYLKNSVRDMMDSSTDTIHNDLTLLLDGTFIGLDGAPDYYNVLESDIYSATLRRILCNMYYGCDYNKEVNYEKDLYRNMWSFYQTNFLDEYTDKDFSYFDSEPEIDKFINLWRLMDEYNIANPDYRMDFWHEYDDDFIACYEQSTINYYTIIINALYGKNVHILAYASGSIFFDILHLVDEDDESNKYVLSDYITVDSENIIDCTELIQEFDIEYFCSMAKASMALSFYNSLLMIQNAVNMNNFNQADLLMEFDLGGKFPIFLWADIDIVWDEDGLEVNTFESLLAYFGDEDEYDQQALEDLFLTLFSKL